MSQKKSWQGWARNAERVIDMRTTAIYRQNAAAWVDPTIRRVFNEGGTSSSKTWSILQLLILIATHAKNDLLISVVSESLPHLKRGCIRDYIAIMGGAFNSYAYNKSEHIYTFGKAKIEFFPADEPSKLRGGRRDILFLNEANNVDYDSYRELDIRTKCFTFLDWNPTNEFWVHEHNLLNQPENAYIHSTYFDALAVIPPEVAANIESNRYKDPNWWNIYGLGRIGKIEGLVYPHFTQVDQLPKGDYFFGLDYGFSQDPTALVKNVVIGNDLYSEELIYETGLTNDAIAHRMDELGVRRNYDPIFADSAEPKSIEEIYRYGFNIKPCEKGAGSVEFGHQRVRQLNQHWTKGSLNCIKEQRNFRYVQDKNGRYTEKTTHMFSHGADARRYAIQGLGLAVAKVDRPSPPVRSRGDDLSLCGVTRREF